MFLLWETAVNRYRSFRPVKDQLIMDSLSRVGAGVQISLQRGWVRVIILIQLDSRWLAVFFFTQARHCLLLLVIRLNMVDHENCPNFTKSTHLKVECLLFYVCFSQQVMEVLHASCCWKSYVCRRHCIWTKWLTTSYSLHCSFCLDRILYTVPLLNNVGLLKCADSWISFIHLEILTGWFVILLF